MWTYERVGGGGVSFPLLRLCRGRRGLKWTTTGIIQAVGKHVSLAFGLVGAMNNLDKSVERRNFGGRTVYAAHYWQQWRSGSKSRARIRPGFSWEIWTRKRNIERLIENRNDIISSFGSRRAVFIICGLHAASLLHCARMLFYWPEGEFDEVVSIILLGRVISRGSGRWECVWCRICFAFFFFGKCRDGKGSSLLASTWPPAEGRRL